LYFAIGVSSLGFDRKSLSVFLNLRYGCAFLFYTTFEVNSMTNDLP